MHLALWYVVLVCHQYDVLKNYVGSVYIGGQSESGLYVFRELCPISFLVVGECMSCGMFVVCCMQCCMSVSAVL